MFTVIHDILLNVFVMGITLWWLSKKYPTISIAVGEIIVLLRTAWQELPKDVNATAVVNEDPAVNEPELSEGTVDQVTDRTADSLTDDLVSQLFQEILNGTSTTAVVNENPAVNEPELAVPYDDQATDHTTDSLTDDLVSPPFPLYYFRSKQHDDDTALAIQEAMRNVMRVVDLTIKGTQTIENCINHFEFLFFDLKLGKDMFAYVHWHMSDQLDWWHYRICDPQLEIVGKLYGALIARGIRLDLPDFWRNPARMIIDHLKNDDVQFSNFANSAYAQIRKDLPSEYSYLIDEIVDGPPKIVRKKKSVKIPAYAQDYKYM